jgi:hypothetical protein
MATHFCERKWWPQPPPMAEGRKTLWPKSSAFFGKCLEVIPNARIVWTNDDSDQGAVTTEQLSMKTCRRDLT